MENLFRANTDFVGREWLFKNLTNFLEKRNSASKGVLLLAAPGFGKSAFIANLVCSKLSSYSIHHQILAFHMCIHSHKSTQDPATFVQNMASLISSRVPEYKDIISSDRTLQKILRDDCLVDPVSGFNNGILYPLLDLSLRFLKPMYIVMDGLDECSSGCDGTKDTTILNILAQSIPKLPKWLKVISTSRNIPDIRRQLSSLEHIELHPNNTNNLHDIERFIYKRAKRSDIDIPPFQISHLVRKSQGNFLYVKLVLDHFEAKGFAPENMSLPESLGSIYQDFFRRKYAVDFSLFQKSRRVFEILATALSPLTIRELYEILLIEAKDFDYEYEFLPLLEDLSMYLYFSSKEDDFVSVFHNSLMEWLTSDGNKGGPFYVDSKKGHRLLAEYYLHKITNGSSEHITPQFVYHLASHIIKGGRLKRQEGSFLDLDQNVVRIRDSHTNATVLHFASGSDNSDILKLVLAHFEDLDHVDVNHRTPAFYSVLFGRFDNLVILYKRGASLYTRSKEYAVKNLKDVEECKRQMCGYDLLHVASQKGYDSIVRYLITHNVNISSLSGTHDQATRLAAEYGHIQTMKTLLDRGVQLDATCLYYASSRGHTHVVEFILSKSIKDNCLDCSLHPSENYSHTKPPFQSYLRLCNTALHAAAINNFPDVVAGLLTVKNNALNCTNFYGRAPLHEAVYHNNYRSVEVFLKHGANPSQICKFTPAHSDPSTFVEYCPCRFTPLHIAAYRGLSSMAHLLILHNASLNAVNCDGLQPIHVAACRGYEDVVTLLVESGVDINVNSTTGMTPIHYACKCGSFKMFDKLFELGADAFATSSDGKTVADYIFEANNFNGSLPSFVDNYADLPIDPVSYQERRMLNTNENALISGLIHIFVGLSKSRKCGFLYQADVLRGLVLKILSQNKSTAKWIELLVGSSADSDFTTVVAPIGPPIHIMLDTVVLQTMLVDKTNILTTAISTIANIIEPRNCSRLILMIQDLLIYSADAYLDKKADVNCEQEEDGLTPILAYLRQGGRHMAKILVKHKVTIDIKCDEYFEDSVFHLAAYHKLHYIHYLSVFNDSNRWEKYLKRKDALFDYLFDEYEKMHVNGRVEIRRIRDGPVVTAIKSHLRGFKIVDECLDDQGYTVLQRAAQGANVVAVKHFLKQGANVSLESPEGFGLLNLTIWYAIKYRPRLNFHEPCLLTALETELASLTAGVILDHLTKEKPLNIRCDQTDVLTLVHLAATRGMWRFIAKLFEDKDRSNVIGLNANCSTKHGITPLYLAHIYGGMDCTWESPWCKAADILKQYGASENTPTPLTEYFIIVNALFHGIPETFKHDLKFDSLLTLEESCGRDECFDYSLHTDQAKLICEIRLGLNTCNRKESLLQDIANALAVKEANLMFSKVHFLGFTKSSIKSIKLLIRKLLSTEHGGQGSCEKNQKPKSTSRSLTDVDMCSGETTILLKDIEKHLKRKYKSYINNYENVEHEVTYVRKAIEGTDHESQRYKDLNRESYLYSRNHLCEWQTATFKYLQLQFLLHALFSWNREVMRYGKYPSVPKYTMERIKKVFFNENRKEFVKFIIELSKDDIPEEYRYLQWLQFRKPPLFHTVFK